MIRVGTAIAALIDHARDQRFHPTLEAAFEDDLVSPSPFKLRPAPMQTPASWPVLGPISSHFGPRSRGYHQGLDIAVKVGTPVAAYADGVVVFVGWRGAYGRAVILDHGEGRRTLYGHLDSYTVNVGDYVTQGDFIAASGNTGRSTGPHLHFEMRRNGQRIDPELGWHCAG